MGTKQGNLIRLIQSFMAGHIACVAAYRNWLPYKRNKIDALVRKAYEAALSLFETARLQLGIHNTLEEIAEAQ